MVRTILSSDGVSGVVDLVMSGIESPKSVAVHPPSGVIFWSDLAKPSIERSDLSGDGRRVIVQDYIVLPAAISIDGVQLRLYWIDVGLQSLSSCSLEGTKVRTLSPQKDVLSQSVSLSILEDWIYWSNVGETEVSIRRLNKMTNSGHEIHPFPMVRYLVLLT